jgi:hypothetical protein
MQNPTLTPTHGPEAEAHAPPQWTAGLHFFLRKGVDPALPEKQPDILEGLRLREKAEKSDQDDREKEDHPRKIENVDPGKDTRELAEIDEDKHREGERPNLLVRYSEMVKI